MMAPGHDTAVAATTTPAAAPAAPLPLLHADPWLLEHKPEIYWNMLQTAEMVAKRYNISKLAQDEYGVRSQLRAAAAAAAGKFDDEIVPMTTIMGVVDKATGTLRAVERLVD